MSVNSKQEKQFAVSKAILDIIDKEGLLGVTHSKVSRMSKVSRPWIYEYIGKEKSSLIDFAANELGEYFSRVNITGLPTTKSELEVRLKEGVDFLFNAAELNPRVIKLFYRYRGSSNVLGEVINKYEKKWLSAASKTLKEIYNLPDDKSLLIAEFILIVRLGYAHRLVTSSETDDFKNKAKQTFDVIHDLLAKAISL